MPGIPYERFRQRKWAGNQMYKMVADFAVTGEFKIFSDLTTITCYVWNRKRVQLLPLEWFNNSISKGNKCSVLKLSEV